MSDENTEVEAVSPAYAGMILTAGCFVSLKLSEPRIRGDDPLFINLCVADSL